MEVYLIWLATIAVALYLYFRQLYSTFSRAGVKSIPAIPIMGNMTWISLRMEHMADQMEKLYFDNPEERFVGRYELLKPMVVVRDIELVKKIAVKDFEHFLDHRNFINEETDPLFGRSLFALKGQEWKEMRSTLSPAFTSSKMRLMLPFMVDVGNQMVKIMKQKIEASGGYIDVEAKDLTTRYANDVIASCAFGTKVDSHSEENNQFYLMGRKSATFAYKELIKLFGFTSLPSIMKFFKISMIANETKVFFKDLIMSTMKIRDEKSIIRNDMIHLLMEAKKGKLTHDTNNGKDADAGFSTVEESSVGKKEIRREWSDDDLVAQAFLFFIAGFDTVSSGMSFLLHELAMNPDIQEQLSQEIKDNDVKNGGKFDYKSIQEMKYMDMVISETFRKWPPVVMLDRICTKDYNCGRPNDKAKKDYIIRKGEGLNIPAWTFHRDPKYFPDPLKFDPERFSDENKHKINTFAYMPFGLGPRNCIGSRFALCEVKVLAYMLLQHFEITTIERTCIPAKLSNDTFNIKLKGGHWVRFKIRN